MLYAILIVALAVAIFGWFKNRLALLSLCYFMQTKNYPPPTDEEARASSKHVIRRLAGFGT